MKTTNDSKAMKKIRKAQAAQETSLRRMAEASPSLAAYWRQSAGASVVNSYHLGETVLAGKCTCHPIAGSDGKVYHHRDCKGA